MTYGYDNNIAQYIQIGGHIFLPLSFFKGMDGFVGVRVHQNRYKSDYLGHKLNLNSTSVVVFMQSSYKINKFLTTELGARYVKGGLMGLVQMGDIFMMEAGLQAKFWDSRFIINTTLSNPFVNFFDGKIRFLNQNIDINRQWEASIFDLTLRYKFGSKYMKDRKKMSSSAQDEVERTTSNKN